MKKLLLGLSTLLVATTALATTLKTIEVKTLPNFKRVSLGLTGKFNYHYMALTKPNRLVIDFADAGLAVKPKALQYHGQLIKSIRASHNAKRTRIVLDLKQQLYPVIYAVKPYHLYVDLYTSRLRRAKKVVATQEPVLTIKDLKKKAVYRPAVMVIDPGHGGKDPGATGPNGIHEKNVVLAISKDLDHDLKQFATIKVDMTRHGDYFVTLRGRLEVARRDKANLFMAIHADSFTNDKARGASVFALSLHGATSEAARWLVNSENHAVLAGASFDSRSHAVQSVLLNLSQSATIQDSLIYGADVVHQLAKVTDMHSHHVDQAPFVVLKSPDIPSLLVETGFISNPFEEHRLNTPSYQHKLAHALMLGILNYLYQYPPHDTLIALQQHGRLTVKVKPGESLGVIAEHYWLTVARLREANHLHSNKLKVGQTLKVPPAKIG